MFKKGKVLFLVAETSVHPGAGSDIGVVDLPIQREVHTGFPVIRGSSLKGAMRDYFESYSELREGGKKESCALTEIKNSLRETASVNILHTIFGPESGRGEGSEFASAIALTDARVLFFPVKSLKEIFAYVTCPLVLKRFAEDLKKVSGKHDRLNGFAAVLRVANEKAVVFSDELVEQDKVMLEEFVFDKAQKVEDDPLAEILECLFPEGDFRREKLQKHLVILSDSDFSDFMKHSTEIVPRIKIDKETGTAQGGALWYEENIPTDAILYSLCLFSDARDPNAIKKDDTALEAEKMLELFASHLPGLFQLGGKETIGHGLIKPVLFPTGNIPVGGGK